MLKGNFLKKPCWKITVYIVFCLIVYIQLIFKLNCLSHKALVICYCTIFMLLLVVIETLVLNTSYV